MLRSAALTMILLLQPIMLPRRERGGRGLYTVESSCGCHSGTAAVFGGLAKQDIVHSGKSGTCTIQHVSGMVGLIHNSSFVSCSAFCARLYIRLLRTAVLGVSLMLLASQHCAWPGGGQRTNLCCAVDRPLLSSWQPWLAGLPCPT
jgi:hypothetical protein